MSRHARFLAADVLGLPSLLRDALSGRPAPAGLALARTLAELGPPPEGALTRAGRDLAHRLEEAATALEPPVAVLEALRRLAEPGASLVLARRPAGLLAAPLATLFAGAQALRLAAELERSWGRPVVAALWIDDTAPGPPEAWVLGRHHDLLRLSLQGLAEGGGPPARVPLEDARHGLGALRAALAQLHGDHAHLGEALGLLVPRAGETLARATARALAGLLGPRGLVPIDPAWLGPELSASLARAAGVDPRPALRTARAALEAAGHGDARALDGILAALRVGPGPPERLRPGGEGYETLGSPGSRTPAELAAAVVQEPLAWSPGPLLLPVCLELALPVAVQLVEPPDLLAHAPRAALLDALGRAPRPLALRAPATLVEPAVRASLGRLGLDVEAVLRARGLPGVAVGMETTPQKRSARTPLGIPLAASAGAEEPAELLRRAAAEARRAVLGPRGRLAELDRGLAGQLARIARGLARELEGLARRAERAGAHRRGTGQRHARRVAQELAPHGQPQEDVLAPFGPIARHGPSWVLGLADELGPLGPEHVVLEPIG